MMNLRLLRVSSQKNSTISCLFNVTSQIKFLCFVLEDEYRRIKVPGKTRIPEGFYPIQLRTEGGLHTKYKKRFGRLHHGMLWIKNIPGFKYVYLHVGNDDTETEGCLLVGNIAVQNVTTRGSVRSSLDAYKRIYPMIASEILKGENVSLEVTNYDCPFEEDV